MTIATFDLAGPLVRGRATLEASAGTGKTYSLTSILVRYIAEDAVPLDQLLVVTFTRAAANELRDRAREAIARAARVLAGEPPGEHTWMGVLRVGTNAEIDERRRRLADAIARFDDLTVTTIHGFCQQALSQVGLRAGGDPDAVLVENVNPTVAEVCRDVIITRLVDTPGALRSAPSSRKSISTPASAEAELSANVVAMMSNPGAHLVPPATVDHEQARLWRELTMRAHEGVLGRQLARRQIGYDTLISGLQQALSHPVYGRSVAEQLAQRYSVVLVDEFQDTDRLQWDVFDRAFSGRTLITVGDPKQAIYRFRGADVYAYLDAVNDVPAFGLDTSHRSDQLLLGGLEHLFRGATLGDARIAFTPVQARPDARFTSFSRDDHADSGADVHLRAVPDHAGLRTPTGSDLSMPLVRTLVLADLVARTVDLLDHGQLATAAEPRRVQPGDIAVLVPTHAEANNVAEALRRAGIPAVRTRTGSVLQTPAAEQWRLLLTALAQPHKASAVRAAALGWFMATDVTELDQSDTTLAALQERAARMADRMRTAGLAAFYDEQKSRGDVLVAVLGRSGGDRHMTDLDHIAELLADATQQPSSEPGQVLRVLDAMITRGDDRSEGAMRRIDSDSMAVQITTIHAAKGLEWPIVLVPFSFKPRANVRTPCSYIDADGRRVLDLASGSMWDAGPRTPGDEATRDNQEARRNLATIDSEGDELRLLYVALTRAKYRLELWWASTQNANTSALARVLLDREGAGPIHNTQLSQSPRQRSNGFTTVKPAYQRLDAALALDQIRHLTEQSGATLELSVLAPRVSAPRWTGRPVAPTTELATAPRHGRLAVGDRSWKRWSFSRLTAAVESASLGGYERQLDQGQLDQGQLDQRDVDQGGVDEPADDTDDFVAIGDTPRTGQLQLGVDPTAHLAGIAGGTGFGTFVHSVLEHLDFASADLELHLRTLVLTHARRDDATFPTDDVVNGLLAAVRTPLGPLFGGRSLTDIGRPDRLDELRFDFPITSRFEAGAIGEAMLATLSRRDPMRPFAARLATELSSFDLTGWMHGSIDAVVRVPQPDSVTEHRYIVIDYKTNRLHEPGATDPTAAYHPMALIPAMEHSRYPLQALLYTVALHRYLRWRLGAAYMPDRHLGGIAYLFLRGMVGPMTPQVDSVAHGVFSWRPPTKTIIEIDRLFTDRT